MNRKQVLITLFAMAIFAVYATFTLQTGRVSLVDTERPLGNTQVDLLLRTEIVILIAVMFLAFLACARFVKKLFP